MQRTGAKARAWVAEAIHALNEHKSWTGRIHTQKLAYIVSELKLAVTPFTFEFYRFGPYSIELDRTVADMETFGQIDKDYSAPGYGPTYSCTALGLREAQALGTVEKTALRRVAQHISTMSGSDLELMATCIWAMRREALRKDAEIIQRVAALKPKYSADRIRASLAQTKQLTKDLTI